MIDTHPRPTWLPQPGVIGMFGAATIWGTWVLILAQISLPSILVTPIASTTGAIALLSLVVISGSLGAFRQMLRDRVFVRMIAWTAFLEVIQFSLYIISFSMAIQDGGSVVIPAIRSMVGVITPLLAIFIIVERFSPRSLIYGLTATLGAIIIFTRGGITLGDNLSYLALGLVTVSVIVRAWFYIEQGRIAREMHARQQAPLHVLCCHVIISALLLIPVVVLYLLFGPRLTVDYIPQQVAFLAIFGLTHISFGALLRLRSMRHLSAQQTVIIMYLEPMTSVALSILFLGEVVNLSFFVGAGLILISAGAASLQRAKRS